MYLLDKKFVGNMPTGYRLCGCCGKWNDFGGLLCKECREAFLSVSQLVAVPIVGSDHYDIQHTPRYFTLSDLQRLYPHIDPIKLEEKVKLYKETIDSKRKMQGMSIMKWPLRNRLKVRKFAAHKKTLPTAFLTVHVEYEEEPQTEADHTQDELRKMLFD